MEVIAPLHFESLPRDKDSLTIFICFVEVIVLKSSGYGHILPRIEDRRGSDRRKERITISTIQSSISFSVVFLKYFSQNSMIHDKIGMVNRGIAYLPTYTVQKL